LTGGSRMLSGKSWGVIFSGKLILRKIIKIVATRCHFNAKKCTKFDFGLGCASDPTQGASPALLLLGKGERGSCFLALSVMDAHAPHAMGGGCQ